MLLDGAGGFNLVHETLPSPGDKQACKDFCTRYEEKIIQKTREEEERLAFKKKVKPKHGLKRKEKDNNYFFD